MAMQQVFGTPKARGSAIDYSGAVLAASFRTGLIAKLIAMYPVVGLMSLSRLRTASRARCFFSSKSILATLEPSFAGP